MTLGTEGDTLTSIEIKVGYDKNIKSNFYRVLGNSERNVLSTYHEEKVLEMVRDYIKKWSLGESDVTITDVKTGTKNLSKKQKDALKKKLFGGNDHM